MRTGQLMRLAGAAKKIIDRRGGTDRLKADAEELRRIARGKGSLDEKARMAAQRLREPGPGARSDGAADGGAPEGSPPADR